MAIRLLATTKGHSADAGEQVTNRVSDAAKKTLDVVAKFVEEECIP
jgi:hypothetical protein